MVKHFTLGKTNITLVFRHRWDNPKQRSWNRPFPKWELGVWFKKNIIVGSRNFSDSKQWKNNMVNSYMLGVEFLLGRVWIEVDRGGMHLDIED
jgi:hypothetical protein